MLCVRTYLFTLAVALATPSAFAWDHRAPMYLDGEGNEVPAQPQTDQTSSDPTPESKPASVRADLIGKDFVGDLTNKDAFKKIAELLDKSTGLNKLWDDTKDSSLSKKELEKKLEEVLSTLSAEELDALRDENGTLKTLKKALDDRIKTLKDENREGEDPEHFARLSHFSAEIDALYRWLNPEGKSDQNSSQDLYTSVKDSFLKAWDGLKKLGDHPKTQESGEALGKVLSVTYPNASKLATEVKAVGDILAKDSTPDYATAFEKMNSTESPQWDTNVMRGLDDNGASRDTVETINILTGNTPAVQNNSPDYAGAFNGRYNTGPTPGDANVMRGLEGKTNANDPWAGTPFAQSPLPVKNSADPFATPNKVSQNSLPPPSTGNDPFSASPKSGNVATTAPTAPPNGNPQIPNSTPILTNSDGHSGGSSTTPLTAPKNSPSWSPSTLGSLFGAAQPPQNPIPAALAQTSPPLNQAPTQLTTRDLSQVALFDPTGSSSGASAGKAAPESARPIDPVATNTVFISAPPVATASQSSTIEATKPIEIATRVSLQDPVPGSSATDSSLNPIQNSATIRSTAARPSMSGSLVLDVAPADRVSVVAPGQGVSLATTAPTTSFSSKEIPTAEPRDNSPKIVDISSEAPKSKYQAISAETIGPEVPDGAQGDSPLLGEARKPAEVIDVTPKADKVVQVNEMATYNAPDSGLTPLGLKSPVVTPTPTLDESPATSSDLMKFIGGSAKPKPRSPVPLAAQ